jgi:hypothetical protein
MPVFLLPDRASFERLLGPRSQGNYGGFYRTDLGCLVVHDQQGGGARGGRNESAMAANLRCLSHEGTHQLCYRSGLLRAGSDIPLAIAEGLAVYGECYMTQGHEAMGQINQSRLNLLFVRDGKSAPWISFDSLLADDRLFDATHNDTQASVAYAQAWLLVHYLLNSQPMLPRFRKYLETIRTRPNREQRMEDVARELGDPTQLLARIRRYGMDLPRRGRSQYESRRRTPASSPP